MSCSRNSLKGFSQNFMSFFDTRRKDCDGKDYQPYITTIASVSGWDSNMGVCIEFLHY